MSTTLKLDRSKPGRFSVLILNDIGIEDTIAADLFANVFQLLPIDVVGQIFEQDLFEGF